MKENINVKLGLILVLFCFTTLAIAQNKKMAPKGLMTNLLSKPESSVLTTLVPKFSWIVPELEMNDYQTAYQIIVASSPRLLEEEKADLWNSGKVTSSNSIHVDYSGEKLYSNTSYSWMVRVWNKEGKISEYSAIQKFNIGDATRTKNWPGESRWVQLSTQNDSTMWTFEDRSPILYHSAYSVLTRRKPNGNWFVDFERAAFSNAALTIKWNSEVEENKVIMVRVGEKSIGDSIDANPGGGVIYKEYPLTIKAGTHSYNLAIPHFQPTYPHSQAMAEQMMEVIPFRYLEVVGKDLDLTVISAEQLRLHVPVDEHASYFMSSDTLLNKVYDLCRYSVIANTFNGDYAASQRERMMYEADAYIHQLGHYAVDREFTTARYSLENMIYHATWPTEWISHSIMMVWMDYLHTGDIDVVRKNYRDIKPKLMLALTMPNGLISSRTGLDTEEFRKSIFFNGKELKDIVDWPWNSAALPQGGETNAYVFQDYNTVVNAFHYHTLTLMEKMARAIGEDSDAALYKRRHLALFKNFQKKFFDQNRGVYVDGVGTDHASLHANLYPLAFGLVPEKEMKDVLDYIKTKGMASGVYSANYLLEGLYNAGQSDYAMSLLTSKSDRSWYNMLHVGATMTTEAWDNKYKNNNGWSHAWSSSPAHILPRKIIGIEPLEPGFKQVRIKPQPSGLTWAKAKLPTIRGSIEAGFDLQPNRTTLTTSLPANISASVYLPIPDGMKSYTLSANGKAVKQVERVDGYFLLKGIGSGDHVFELDFER